MSNISEIFFRAYKKKWAVGHFNFSELDQARAIVEVCKESGAPAMLGTSEGERKHVGLKEAVALRDAFRKEFSIPVFLNADHTKSVDAAHVAVDAGYDSIHIDLSALPFEENVAGTREIVEYARVQSTSVHVEGELGYLRGSSEVQKERIEIKPEDLTNPEEAKEFVEKTGVDRLAVAVGNLHGIAANEPHIDIERIRAIRKSVPEAVTLVLHGGSGILDEDIQQAIAAGMANVHVNTELRMAFVGALRASLEEHVDEVAMYKLDAEAIDAMKKVVKEKLELFGSVGKV